MDGSGGMFEHFPGCEGVVDEMHPHRNPDVAGPLTGEAQDNAEEEEIPEDDRGVLHVQTGPDEGSEDEGEN